MRYTQKNQFIFLRLHGLWAFFLLVYLMGCLKKNQDLDAANNSIIPKAPSVLVAKLIDSTHIDLHWTDRSNNESGFRIERAIFPGIFNLIATTNANDTTFSDTGLIPLTTYVYRVYSCNAAGISIEHSNEVTIITSKSSIISTKAVTSITNSTAISGGDIISDGGVAITAKGVCWSTNANPTISLSTKTNNGTGASSFSSNITGLMENTIYYVRAYSTNINGTSYGEEFTFSTNVNLPSVTIGNQVWTNKNLDVSQYRNGDPIPYVSDSLLWASLTTGAWCWFNNDSATYASVYGKLYNWYAVNDSRGLAPQGWRIPNESEWNKLVKYLDVNADTFIANGVQSATAGGILKETGTLHWSNPNVGATNAKGFKALPGSFRDSSAAFLDAIGDIGTWWSATEKSADQAWFRFIFSSEGSLNKNDYYKKAGFSVRCVRNW